MALAEREMKRVTLVLRSLLLNRTETLATQARFSVSRHTKLIKNNNNNNNNNNNKDRSIDKVRNLGNKRRQMHKDPRQDSGQKNIPYTRYPKKCFTQIYRDLYGDAMLVPTWMSTNMADGNQQKHLLPSFGKKA